MLSYFYFERKKIQIALNVSVLIKEICFSVCMSVVDGYGDLSHEVA